MSPSGGRSGKFRQTYNGGIYRWPIVIVNPPADSSRDAFGGRVGQGSVVATLLAAKEDWSGSEIDEKGRETAIVITKFRVRWHADLTILPQMWIQFGADTFNILTVLDYFGTQRELVLECRKVVA